MKLLEHFKNMQAACAAYIEPTPTYTSLDGRVSPVGSLEKQGRDRLFIEDMIYMLDGPEQREAQAEAEQLDEYHLDWRMDIREQVSQANTVASHFKAKAESRYPTEHAYLAACRAGHWRTEQLCQAGIEPLDLTKVGLDPLPHYPPQDFRFPIEESFPDDDHRQIYHAWRRFPRAMKHAMVVMFLFGVFVGILIGLVPAVFR